jgi:hypothetical protein
MALMVMVTATAMVMETVVMAVTEIIVVVMDNENI